MKIRNLGSRCTGRRLTRWGLTLALAVAASAAYAQADDTLRLRPAERLNKRAEDAIDAHLTTRGMALARQAEQVALAAHDPGERAWAVTNIGNAYLQGEAYQPALRTYLRALALHERNDDLDGQSACLSNLGSLCVALKQKAAALRYYRRSLGLFEQLGDSLSVGLLYCNIASIISDQPAERPLALVYYQRALRLLRQAHEPTETAKALNNLATLHLSQGQPAVALPYLTEALSLNSRQGNAGEMALNLIALGSAHRDLRHWDQAATYYAQALRIGHHVPRVARDTHLQLAELYELTGRPQESLRHYRRYEGLKDSLFSKEAADRITDVETRYRTREQQRQIQVQRLTIERQHQLAALGFGAGALALLAAGALGLLFWHRTRANHRLAAANAEISRAMAEKETLLTEKTGLVAEKEMLLQEVHHRVKNNLQLVSGLLGWQAEADPAAAAALNQSRTRLHSLALIHEHLYRADDLARVRLDEYLSQLLNTLAAAHANPHQSILLTTELAPLTMGAKEAIPLGLITNELILNAYKHAFRGRSAGRLHVTLTGAPAADNGRAPFRLVVEDDGVGVREADEAPVTAPTSLGMQLVRMMTRQLKATLVTEANVPAGTRFVLERG